jgi:hypothetical protein
MTGPARYWQIPYYHWSWRERCAVIPIQNQAFQSGRLRRPETCSICLAYRPGRKEGRWQIAPHTERYDRPFELFPVCRNCHSKLHNRYANPARWRDLLEEYPRRTEWFHQLDFDVSKQFLHFDNVYPLGLASPLNAGLTVPKPQLTLPLPL